MMESFGRKDGTQQRENPGWQSMAFATDQTGYFGNGGVKLTKDGG
jgi:hypothetical protein